MALLRKMHGGDDDEIASIVDNLNNILNTKRGWGFFLQDFGISDYNHLSSRDDIAEAIIREVGENIEHFEPRVMLVKIVELKDDALFRLSFRIDCVVRNNARSLKLFMDPLSERYQVNQ
ncbi:MAG: type VI secretion system baseplate subunit TssE [Candidatus Methylumidiphilus sp.]